jgi:hypothetical protein
MEEKIIFNGGEDLIGTFREGFLNIMRKFADKGLIAYNEGNSKAYELASRKYNTYKRMSESLGVNVSKYPDSLDELIK